MNWGALAVYSCPDSCDRGEGGSKNRIEVVVMHLDPTASFVAARERRGEAPCAEEKGRCPTPQRRSPSPREKKDDEKEKRRR